MSFGTDVYFDSYQSRCVVELSQISMLDDLDDGGCRRWGFRVELASTGPMKLIVIFII
jgi:hypothetical protein